MKKIYFQNEVVVITYDEKLQMGIATWDGFLNSERFREAINMCLQLIEEYKPLRWLGDNRKMKAIRQADQQWFAEYVLPKLQSSSLRRNAVLQSEDFFNRQAVEQLYKRAAGQGDLITKEFNSMPLAMVWLSEPIMQEQA